MLIYAGPIIAILDRSDAHHQRCVEVLKRMPAGKFLTTWPCFTEAMYLLGEVGGYAYQSQLGRWHSSMRLSIHDLSSDETAHMTALMERYQDQPMDLADASLVSVADSLHLKQVFRSTRIFTSTG